MRLFDRPVSEIMQRDVATLSSGDRLDLADDIMNLGRVRHMPVLDDDCLVGIVSSRDLLAASLSLALDFDAQRRRTFMHSVDVGEVMSRDVVTIGPETTLREAAGLLIGNRIGCLPVVKGGDTLVGLVTETDLLRAAFIAGNEDESIEAGSSVGDAPLPG